MFNNNINGTIDIKSLQSEYTKYLDDIKKKQKESVDLAEKLKHYKRLNTIHDNEQNQILNNFEKQITSLCKRCEYTENLICSLNQFFNHYSELVVNIEECMKMNNQTTLNNKIVSQCINNTNKSLSIDSNNNNNNNQHSHNASATTNVSNLSYIEYIHELEQPYDVSKIDTNNPNLASTQHIANSLKENLIKYKISQQLFAETILNMKQANLSALLSQPSTWATLSQINRNRFLTIYMWLNDSRRFERINFIKSKLNLDDANKYPSQLPQNNTKRRRTILTKYQQDRLKQEFQHNCYPSSDHIDLLAVELNLNPKKVSTWFTHQRQQNRMFKITFI